MSYCTALYNVILEIVIFYNNGVKDKQVVLTDNTLQCSIPNNKYGTTTICRWSSILNLTDWFKSTKCDN